LFERADEASTFKAVMSGLMNRAVRCVALLGAMAVLQAHAQDASQFDIFEYVIEGNSVLPNEAIERAVYPFLGESRSAEDVNRAAQALEKVYQDAGYLTVAVGIPEQAVTTGVVRLEVSEGKVERLKVTGAEYTLPSHVREQAPSLAEGEVPHFPEVQEDLGRLGRNADLRVTPLLQPGRTPGAVNVELRLEETSPLHGSVGLSNRRSADTDSGRLEASIRYDNLWQRRHSVGVSYFAVPSNRDQIEVWGVNYAAPLGDGFLAGFFARSNSNIPTLFDTTSLGRGDVAGVRWIKPLPDRGLGFSHSFSLGLDWKDNQQDTRGIGGTDFSLSQPVKYWVLNGQYNLSVPFESGARLRVGTTLNVGASAMNERRIDCNGFIADQFNCRRPGATPDFVVARLELEGALPLGAGWGVTGRLDIQRSNDLLINSEQFSAGGFDSVRGYLESERLGDEGERVRLELVTPGWSPADGYALRGRVFYDWAGLRIREAFIGQEARASLEGTGIGLRLDAPHGFNVDADWAIALRDGASGRTGKGDNRLLVNVGYEF
jgi:hemolysin activation/secretion protein